jgi:hypothetical protein
MAVQGRVAVALAAFAIVCWLGTSIIGSRMPSQNALVHLGVATDSGPVETLRSSEWGGQFTDQHWGYHALLKGLSTVLNHDEVTRVAVGLGLGLLVATVTMISAGPPILAAGAATAMVFSVDPFFSRISAGRPSAYVISLMLLLAAFFATRHERGGWRARAELGLIASLWASLGLTALLAPVVALACASSWRQKLVGSVATGLFVLAVWSFTMGPVDAASLLFETVRAHWAGAMGVYEWRPTYKLNLLWPMIFFVGVAVVTALSRRDQISKSWQQLVFFVLLPISIFAVRATEYLIPATLVLLLSTRKIEPARVLGVLLFGIGLFAAMNRQGRFVGDGSLGPNVSSAILWHQQSDYKAQPLISLEWSGWSQAMAVSTRNRVEPGFSLHLYPEAVGRAAQRVFWDRNRSSPLDLDVLQTHFRSDLFLVSRSAWQEFFSAPEYGFEVLQTEPSALILRRTSRVGPAQLPTMSEAQRCKSIRRALDLVAHEGRELLEVRPVDLQEMRRTFALWVFCRQQVVSPNSALVSLCGQFSAQSRERLLGARLQGRLTSGQLALDILDAQDRNEDPAVIKDAVELLKEFLFEGRVRSVRYRTETGHRYLSFHNHEIINSGQVALVLLRNGEDDLVRRLAEASFHRYKTEFQHSILYVHWWSEVLAKAAAPWADAQLIDIFNGMKTIDDGPYRLWPGCLGPLIPGHGPVRRRHHLTGQVHSGLVFARLRDRPEFRERWPWIDRLEACSAFDQLPSGLFPVAAGLEDRAWDVHAHVLYGLLESQRIQSGQCSSESLDRKER